jgi:hypothetical protein
MSSEFEKLRESNIRRNEEFLAELGFDNDRNLGTCIPGARSKATKRGATTDASKKKLAAVPIRRSGRVTIERIKVELASAKDAGDEELLEAKGKELENLVNAKLVN